MKPINSSLLSAVIIAVLLLSACSSLNSQSQRTAVTPAAPASPLGNAEYYTHLLANELFAGMRPSAQTRYAVTTFVPVDTLSYKADSQHPLMLLGHQLAQGMVTEATQRGFITQDFKTANDIIIEAQSDRVFSRNVEQLTAVQQVDFFISGTITQQQEGAMVNARIINARNKDVVAAATRFFPAEIFWLREQVTHRNGMIYRTGTE